MESDKMNFVEPIRDRKKITQIKNLLSGAQRYRDLLLFVVGINAALRISDLLALRIGALVDERGHPRKHAVIREQKRGKRNEVVVNDSIQVALKLYLKAYPEVLTDASHFVFFSARRSGPIFTRPLSRSQAARLMSDLCHAVGLSGHYSTHTLRKTWGYHARQHGVTMEIIMEKLHHSNFAVTKRYLGITDDELRRAAEGLNL
jgi:integrase